MTARENKEALRGGISTPELKMPLWRRFFKTGRHIFKSSAKADFHFQILTDGVGCSILFKRKGAAVSVRTANKMRFAYRKVVTSESLADLTPDEMAVLLEKITVPGEEPNLLAADPGKRSLSKTVGVPTGGRGWNFTLDHTYSAMNRRKDLHTVKNRHRLERQKQHCIIENQTVKQWETAFAESVPKGATTTSFTAFKWYIREVNSLSQRCAPFYLQTNLRNAKFGAYVRQQIAEDRLVKSFRKTFPSDPEKTLLVFGNWNEGHAMKFHAPTKGMGLRRIFVRAGYNVKTVDEFRTSCRCSVCEGPCETFRYTPNPRPHQREARPTTKRHGLLKCLGDCHGRLWNRDINGASNIFTVAYHLLNGWDRPAYLSRGAQN